MDLVRDINLKEGDRRVSPYIKVLSLTLILAVWCLDLSKMLLGGGSIWAFPAIPVVVVLHEALHGLCFLAWTGKVKFGFTMSYIGPSFYSSASGKILARNKFIVLALLPQLLTLVGIYLHYIIGTDWLRFLALNVAALNFGGGASDFYVAWVLLHCKKDVKVEDYVEGVRVYA